LADAFRGSKLKIVEWIWDAIKDLDFASALDAFGGTACVGYMLKEKGKKVIYNDLLKFNWYIGLALIENDKVKLTDKEVDFLLTKHSGSTKFLNNFVIPKCCPIKEREEKS
jgi:adenine-specific DNA methylase